MALIDSDKLVTCLVWSGLVDKATCGELKEAIEQCTVKDIYTNTDIVAMFTDLQTEIEELKNEPACCQHFVRGIRRSSEVIQQKIDKLKGQTMTVENIREQLNNYPDDLEIILTNDDVFLPGLYKATETRQEDGYLYIDTDFEERI